MSGHCHSHDEAAASRPALLLCLVLNAGMFLLELWQGSTAGSTALLADSIDFFSDAATYGVTLLVMGQSLRVRAKAAIVKAASMLLLAGVTIFYGIRHYLSGTVPDGYTMSWVACLALAVNVTCALVLYKTRGTDSNMRSVWLCSRNDAAGNVLVLLAAAAVHLTVSLWPDLIAAAIIAGLATHSALEVFRHAKRELKETR